MGEYLGWLTQARGAGLLTRAPEHPRILMRHFGYLTADELDLMFAVAPKPFGRDSAPSTLALALGATLYSPGTRLSLTDDAARAATIGATSQVWCLEDAIADSDVDAALDNVVRQLAGMHQRQQAGQDFPLLFVRVRSPEQITAITTQAGQSIHALTGFVLPKFTPDAAGTRYLTALRDASDLAGIRLYGLPVLEHPDLAWVETRRSHLVGIRGLLDAHRDQILSVRVGATDLCGLFGLRRDADTTIWDVAVVRDMLADVINVFGRRSDFVVSGPVWEHFAGPERLFKPLLRTTPFQREGQSRLRMKIVREDKDELLREVALDRANGFTGKTVIHPTHVSVVNALSPVAREEYDDALAIAAARHHGGASRSTGGTRMNEVRPHSLWAEQVLARAAVYGVLTDSNKVVDLLERGRAVAEAAYRPQGISPSVR